MEKSTGNVKKETLLLAAYTSSFSEVPSFYRQISQIAQPIESWVCRAQTMEHLIGK